MECSKIEDKSNEALADQANHTIQSLLDKDYFTSKFSPHVVEIFSALIKSVPHSQVTKTFDAILETIVTPDYIEVFMKNIDVLLELVRLLVLRIQHELEYLKKFPVQNTPNHIMAKCWSIIRKIGEIEEYSALHLGEFEKAMEPLLPELDNEKNELLTENLLSFVQTTIKLNKNVTPFAWKVFQHFPKIFDNFQNMLSSIFPPLNQIIVYGHGEINKDPEAIKILVEMGISGLVPSNPIADESNVSEAALLLQLILQYLQPLTEEQFQNIIVSVIDRIPNADNDFLKARYPHFSNEYSNIIFLDLEE